MYRLYRVSDQAGDSGPMSLSIEIGSQHIRHNARPTLGECMRVGSYGARSFQRNDWWQTTPVTEITLDTPNRVEFKTRNSEYVWDREHLYK